MRTQLDSPFTSDSENRQKESIYRDQLIRFYGMLSQAYPCQQQMLLSIASYNLCMSQLTVQVSAMRSNGSAYAIPNLYYSFFKQSLPSGQNVRYIPTFINSNHFTANIELKLTLFRQQQSQYQDKVIRIIVLAISKFHKFLQLTGCLRKLNKFAFKLKRDMLEGVRDTVEAFNEKQQKLMTPVQSMQNQQITETVMKVGLIKEIEDITPLTKKGGYFSVDYKKCEIIKTDGSIYVKDLAQKKLLTVKKVNDKCKQKLFNQLKLIRQIKNTSHLVGYYYQEQVKDYFYMDYVKNSLRDVVNSKDSLTIQETFTLILQLVQSVKQLHQSGIVHRDLKLQNILVDQNGTGKHIKIIDFSDSAAIGVPVQQQNLGCSIPYSPIECLIKGSEGCSNPQIDLWSVPIIIFEVVFGRLPLFYTKFMQNQIVEQWKTDCFFTILPHYPKYGIRKLEQLMCLLMQKSLKIEQKQRLSLRILAQYIKQMQKFYAKTKKTFYISLNVSQQ